MSYENAPATQMIASHCCVCNRPLVDSVSVELGIGPDCRKKHGYNVEATEENRKYLKAKHDRLGHEFDLGSAE